ncbi:MAG: RNA polymerase Rpb4 family protein [Candidatus Micrarchaeota archaeon]
MIGKKTLEIKPVTLGEVTAILEKRAEEGELGFEQQATLDHAKKFTKITPKKARELIEKLSAVEKVSGDVAVKIADILPRTTEELNLLFAKERYNLTKEEATEVLNIVKEYR